MNRQRHLIWSYFTENLHFFCFVVSPITHLPSRNPKSAKKTRPECPTEPPTTNRNPSSPQKWNRHTISVDLSNRFCDYASLRLSKQDPNPGVVTVKNFGGGSLRFNIGSDSSWPVWNRDSKERSLTDVTGSVKKKWRRTQCGIQRRVRNTCFRRRVRTLRVTIHRVLWYLCLRCVSSYHDIKTLWILTTHSDFGRFLIPTFNV